MTPRHCPECGASLPTDAPGAACPRCLLLRGFESIPPDERLDSRATVHLVLPEEPDGVLPFPEIADYELLKEIGRGGMGIIYQARQQSLDRLVALKLIRAGLLASTDSVARFKLEAAATARLRHPGIVAVHEVGEHEGQHFYSMDFVPGRSLAVALRGGPLTPRTAAACVHAVAEAIHFAHEQGVIHRDLKPSNILLDAEGEPRVSDFGLAKLLQSDSELTLTGAVLGSPNYMPPEQARGQHAEVGVRSDVYALGAILYECLTGRPPFTAATPLETMKLVVEQEPISPRVLNATLPRDLETICLKCLQKQPAQRYGSTEALADDLERWLRGELIHARPSQIWERGIKWAKRQPARASLLALSLLAPLIIIALLLVTGAKVTRERNLAVQQEQKAKASATRAEASELAARERAYAADIYAACQALVGNDLALARRLLNEHRPKAMTNDELRMANRVPSPTGRATVHPQPATDLRGFEWRVLWERTRGQDSFAFTNLARPANCLAFAPDGRTLLSGGDDGIHLWDIVERRPLSLFPGPDPGPPNGDLAPTAEDVRPMLDASPAVVEHLKAWPSILDYLDALGHTNRTRNVSSLAFTPDGKHLLVGSSDFVRSWNFETRAFEFAIPEARSTVATPSAGDTFVVGNDHQANPDDEAPSAHGQSALIYSFARRRLVAELPGYGRRVALSPDGQLVAAANRTNGSLLWRHATGETIPITSDPFYGGILAFSPDGRTLLMDPENGRPSILWDVASKRIRGFLQGKHLAGLTMTWSPDGRWLAGGNADQSIRIWKVPPPEEACDLSKGPSFANPTATLSGHEAGLKALVFSPDGRWLCSAANDHSIRFWAFAEAEAPLAQWDSDSNNSQDQFAMDLKTGCVIGRVGKELTVWDAGHGYVRQALPGTQRQFHAGFLSNGAGFVTVEMATNGKPVQLLIRRLPDGVVQACREIHPPPKEFEPLETDGRPMLVGGPNGRWLAVAQRGRGRRSEVHVFAIGTGQFVAHIPEMGRGWLWGLRASPDSRWLVRLHHFSGENVIAIYDTEDWRLTREIRFRSADIDVLGAAIDPTGRLMATGGARQNSLRIWNLLTGEMVAQCNGSVAAWSPVWSRDGRTLAVTDGERIRFVSMIVFRELAACPRDWHHASLLLGFTADNQALVSLKDGHEIRTWSPPTVAEIDGGGEAVAPLNR